MPKNDLSDLSHKPAQLRVWRDFMQRLKVAGVGVEHGHSFKEPPIGSREFLTGWLVLTAKGQPTHKDIQTPGGTDYGLRCYYTIEFDKGEPVFYRLAPEVRGQECELHAYVLSLLGPYEGAAA